MFRIALLITLISVTLGSCGSERVNNVEEGNIVRDEEGRIISGEMKKFFVNGKLESVFNIANYKMHGPAKKYYEDGKTLRSALIYNEGKLDGLQKRYYESGALYKEEPYVKGKRHGLVKKYRENGNLMTEAMYQNGQPGIILKEYLTDGSLKTKYPKIVVQEVNTIRQNGEYIIRISMSDATTKVRYFFGELDEGGYFSENLKEQTNVFEGVLELKAYLNPGEKLDQEINIVARMPTRLNNTYLTTHDLRLNVSR